MKKQDIISIVNKDTFKSIPYSALTELHKDFKDNLNVSLSYLQKQPYPIDLGNYVIDKEYLRKTQYKKTNHGKLNV